MPFCSDNEPEPRTVPCGRCKGEGVVRVVTGYSWRDGEALGWEEDCGQCGGSGEEETER